MKKSIIKKGIITLLVGMLLCASLLSGCGDTYTADDLQNARERRARGEKLNREDSHMLEGFDKWKANQNKYADY